MADIHIGEIKDIAYVYDVLKDIFNEEIHMNRCDAVIILGDFFHTLLRTNDEYVKLSIDIVSHLVKLCKRNKTKIRMIYGTMSHEMGQYNIFNYHKSEDGVDFRVIEEVESEELFPGINVLYIPEEYVESKREYYKNYLYSDKKYSYIFGHGVIAEGMPMIHHIEKPKSGEKQVPIFKSQELTSISDIVAFGHYHCRNEHYIGSLFRNSFGEEDPKGYGIIEDGELKFIENTRAYSFKTYELDSKINTDSLMRSINDIKETNSEIFDGVKFGKIRIKMSLTDEADPTFRENIRSLLFSEKSIVPMITEVSQSDKKEEDVEEEYDYILDKDLNPYDKIHRFITEELKSDLTLDEVKKYIDEGI